MQLSEALIGGTLRFDIQETTEGKKRYANFQAVCTKAEFVSPEDFPLAFCCPLFGGGGTPDEPECIWKLLPELMELLPTR